MKKHILTMLCIGLLGIILACSGIPFGTFPKQVGSFTLVNEPIKDNKSREDKTLTTFLSEHLAGDLILDLRTKVKKIRKTDERGFVFNRIFTLRHQLLRLR
jgi:hypothetical protein